MNSFKDNIGLWVLNRSARCIDGKSLTNGWKFFVNSDSLSYNTFRGQGYGDNQTWSNILEILADVLYLSNHIKPASGQVNEGHNLQSDFALL